MTDKFMYPKKKRGWRQWLLLLATVVLGVFLYAQPSNIFVIVPFYFCLRALVAQMPLPPNATIDGATVSFLCGIWLAIWLTAK